MTRSANRNRARRVCQQRQHLGLHGDAERRDRLIADKQPRPRDEGPRDAHALRLPARHLVREATREGGGKADLSQRLRHAILALGPPHAGGMGQERLGHAVAHPHARVERGMGVLEHHLHLAPERPEDGFGDVRHVPAAPDHAPLQDRRETQERASER